MLYMHCMSMSFVLLVIILLYAHKESCGQSMYETFHSNFDQKCLRHGFVSKFFENQYNNPTDRYLVFTFHAHGIRNGGIGDRMGGLISAAALAIALNRTLIIRSQNGFDELFRPYHPDQNSVDIRWNSAEEWSNFDAEEYEQEKTDPNYALDMDDCVSNTEEGFAPSQKSKCAFLLPDFDQQVRSVKVIRFTSNRAYLCLWRPLKATKVVDQRTGKRVTHPVYGHIARVFGRNTPDLYEIAGCLLRLTMWPTEKMWGEVDRAYLSSPLFNPLSYVKKREEKKKGTKKGGKKKGGNKEGEKGGEKRVKKIKGETEEEMTLQHLSPYSTSVVHSPFAPYQLGLHFRCGDIYSYAGGGLGSGGHDEGACVFDEDEDAGVKDFGLGGTGGKERKSRYMNAGHPLLLGVCAQQVLGGERSRGQWREMAVSLSGSSVSPQFLIFASSDNPAAAEQMAFYSQHNLTLLSPPSCHIELDPTPQCFLFTATYWLVLALSNKLITQTYGQFNMPTSAFSRYGGMYGLHGGQGQGKGNGNGEVSVFHSGRYCEDDEMPHTILSKQQQGNWICSMDYQ